MATENSASSAEQQIGQVFTPIHWARWAIAEGPYQDWLTGGTILDPTGGTGAFLEAFLETAASEGLAVTDEMLGRLFLVERDPSLCETAIRRLRERFGVALPLENIVHQDFFTYSSSQRATSVVGNPPWVNFTDLPETYKRFVKPYFIKYGLVPNRRRVLWGGSRIDLAAAVIAKCLQDHCVDGGSLVMFLPLSIFLNDGAHQPFRELSFRHQQFTIEKIHDLADLQVFESINTRYCLAKLRKDRQTSLPIDYWIHSKDAAPQRKDARPFSSVNNSLVIGSIAERPVACVPRKALPRQGVNTCGANRRFFFDTMQTLKDGSALLSNASGEILVEAELVFPLITAKNFGAGESARRHHKFVLLPYDLSTARPLDESDLRQAFPLAWKYLLSIAEELKSRKGKMLGVQMKRGHWWALLGVGKYTFAPFKVVWQAYGQTDFQPELFAGQWIPNQSLQAYMPFDKEETAMQVLDVLKASNIADCLRASRTSGTASWAQPGKIKGLLDFQHDDAQRSLFEI